MICWAWEDFIEKERLELLHAGKNSTTSAYMVCDFYPYNPNPEAWRQVLGNLGKQNDELNKKEESEVKKVSEYEVRIKDTANESSLTREER